MIRLVGLIIVAFLAIAHGLQRYPLPVSELAKQTRPLLESAQATRSDDLEDVYPAYNLSLPINHFPEDPYYEPHPDGTFDLRYWFDAQFYKPGGPVIVLCSGETSGAGRLPFLQKGIVYELAKATGGLGVILEHRYYGTSVPFDDFSTEHLRFLTTEQALADTEYFAKHVEFDGLEDADLQPHQTPWITYGGSYAGAFSAFLRVQYPDVFFGSISSSGVPKAIWDYWEYYEAARIFGPPICIETTQIITDVVDRILIHIDDPKYTLQLKEAFGLRNLTHDDDFANTITRGISSFQSLNWDPAVSDNAFFEYCANISTDSVIYPATEKRRASVEELLSIAGYEDELDTLTNHMLNYIGWINITTVSTCHRTQDECFTAHNTDFYEQDGLSQTWRLWLYQVCTEWGYLQTGSGVPSDRLPLVSRLIDVEFSSIFCRDAFNLTKSADLERINRYGGFEIQYPRLAFVDGEWDPWRAAGVHAEKAPERKSTTSEPSILIDKAVHHWDENGLFPNETTPKLPPHPVVSAKQDMVDFVKEWLEEWNHAQTSIGTLSSPSEL